MEEIQKTDMWALKFCCVTVVSVVNALELKEHLHKQAKMLSAGLKRKVKRLKMNVESSGFCSSGILMKVLSSVC